MEQVAEANALDADHVVGDDVEVVEVVDAAPSGALTALSPLVAIKVGLDALAIEARSLNLESSSTADDKKNRAFRQRAATLSGRIDDAYDKVNRPMLEIQREARKLRDSIKEELAGLKAPVDAAIRALEVRKEQARKAKEEAERQRIAEINSRIAAIAAAPAGVVTMTSKEIFAKGEELGAMEVTEELFGEFALQAEDALSTALSQIAAIYNSTVERELEDERLRAERAELERQRQEQEQEQAQERARIAQEQERIRREGELLAQRQAEAANAAAMAEAAKALAEANARELQKAAEQRQAAERAGQVDAFEEERAAAQRIADEAAAISAREQAEKSARQPGRARASVPAKDPAPAPAAPQEDGPAEPVDISKDAVVSVPFAPRTEDMVAVISNAYRVTDQIAWAWLKQAFGGAK